MSKPTSLTTASNLVDIPTDCPQRDERMGWTGDIAVFSPTACYNFDMGRFLNKWMRDVEAEQSPGGGIPNTVPRCGYGFPGTPYNLFALVDNGHADTAYKMLLNTRCPSWLYEVKMGATTIWERWDGLDENGVCPIGDDGTDMMISCNHYASGAVGDFLYRRVLAGKDAVQLYVSLPYITGGLEKAAVQLLDYGKTAAAVVGAVAYVMNYRTNYWSVYGESIRPADK